MANDDLVKISEDGDGQENKCPICGAEPGDMCSGLDPDNQDDQLGVEYGRYVHRARQSHTERELDLLEEMIIAYQH